LSYIDSVSDDLLERIYRKAHGRMRRAFQGGDQYGIDWATLRLVCPGWYTALDQLFDEMYRRKMIFRSRP